MELYSVPYRKLYKNYTYMILRLGKIMDFKKGGGGWWVKR
jgi:hypothetical protein